MFDFFSDQPDDLLGVDIGTKNIKLTEIKKGKEGKMLLANYAIATLSEASARDISTQEIAGIVKNTVKQAGIKTRDAAFSLPAYSTFLTLVDMPRLSDNELDQLIPVEAKKYIPIPVDKVTMGWSRVKEKILLIAVPKTLSRHYAEIAALAELDLKTLEAETFSLARALARDETGCAVLIDVGARSTNVSLIEKGNVFLNRTLSKEAYNIQAIAQIINKSGQKIDSVIMTGGELKSEIEEELKKLLPQAKLQRGDPWKNIIYPKELGARLKELSPILSVSVGLAIRDFIKLNPGA